MYYMLHIKKCVYIYIFLSNIRNDPHKALSFARSASTSDSPLVPQLLTVGLKEDDWKAGVPALPVPTSISFSVALTLSNTLSLSGP